MGRKKRLFSSPKLLQILHLPFLGRCLYIHTQTHVYRHMICSMHVVHTGPHMWAQKLQQKNVLLWMRTGHIRCVPYHQSCPHDSRIIWILLFWFHDFKIIFKRGENFASYGTRFVRTGVFFEMLISKDSSKVRYTNDTGQKLCEAQERCIENETRSKRLLFGGPKTWF